MSSLALEISPDEIRAPARPPPRLGTSVAEWRAHRRASLRPMPPVARIAPLKPSPIKPTLAIIPAKLPEILPVPVVDTLSVIRLCSIQFGVSVSDIRYGGRKRCFVRPRQVAMYLCKKHLGRKFTEIARKLGWMDHSTVIYGVRHIAGLIATDPILAAHVAEIEKKITGETARDTIISNYGEEIFA